MSDLTKSTLSSQLIRLFLSVLYLLLFNVTLHIS